METGKGGRVWMIGSWEGIQVVALITSLVASLSNMYEVLGSVLSTGEGVGGPRSLRDLKVSLVVGHLSAINKALGSQHCHPLID